MFLPLSYLTINAQTLHILSTMEYQTQRPSTSPSTAETKKSQSRLQRHAPATLQLNAGHSDCKGWENGTPSRSPIPLLSPLFVAREQLMEGDGELEQENEKRLASTEAGVWRHPVLPAAAVTETAGLVPLFQSQCGIRP